MIYQGVDTAARITAERAATLRNENYDFVVRYLVPESGSTKWKALTADESNDILASGLSLMLCWETTAKRVKSGASAGLADGKAANQLAEKMGVPEGTVIYFAADYDVQQTDIPMAEAYYRAAQGTIGKYVVGVYGGERICRAMSERGFTRLWQCVAWTNEFLSESNVIQYEWQGGSDATALAEKLGVSVDLDSATTLDGMWGVPVESSETETEDSVKWATKMGIITDDMRDVSQMAVMLRRYHNIFSAEDTKTVSGLLTN